MHSLLFELKFSTLNRSRSLSIIIIWLVFIVILISINLSVNSLGWTGDTFVSIIAVALVSLYVRTKLAVVLLLLLLIHTICEYFCREKATTTHINFFLDYFKPGTTPLIVIHPILVVLWILHVLLLLVQVVLLYLFLQLDVLLVNSVDLLSQVLMLPLESLD